MSAAASLSRRGLTGFLGSWRPSRRRQPNTTPDDALARCLAWLMEADREFAGLPDDDPGAEAPVARMDTLLCSAAKIRSVTDRGFALKARIARVYGDCPAGEMVQRWLLSDLMTRGKAA